MLIHEYYKSRQSSHCEFCRHQNLDILDDYHENGFIKQTGKLQNPGRKDLTLWDDSGSA